MNRPDTGPQGPRHPSPAIPRSQDSTVPRGTARRPEGECRPLPAQIGPTLASCMRMRPSAAALSYLAVFTAVAGEGRDPEVPDRHR